MPQALSLGQGPEPALAKKKALKPESLRAGSKNPRLAVTAMMAVYGS